MNDTRKPCSWRCGDDSPGHKHYAVLIREKGGKLLGRLTPNGKAAHNKIYAAILGKTKAERIAHEINTEGNYSAKVIPFGSDL